jgi:hypothetical protein
VPERNVPGPHAVMRDAIESSGILPSAGSDQQDSFVARDLATAVLEALTTNGYVVVPVQLLVPEVMSEDVTHGSSEVSVKVVDTEFEPHDSGESCGESKSLDEPTGIDAYELVGYPVKATYPGFCKINRSHAYRGPGPRARPVDPV